MIITEVLQIIEKSEHPISRLLHKNEHCKILVLAFKAGMILKEHSTPFEGKLVVLNGNIIFKQNGIATTVKQYEEINILKDIIHSVEAIEDSLCLLCL